MSMKKLVMATNNADKLYEVRQMLNGIYDVCSLADIGCHEDIPETADSSRKSVITTPPRIPLT